MNRRSLVLSLAAPAIGFAADISTRPSTTPRMVFAYRATVKLAMDITHGKTPLGTRTRAPIIGGEFSGPKISGKVIPGGADWQLLRADGFLVLEADYFMEEADGTQIHVHNKGLWHSATGDWPADYALTTPEFEVPIGKHDWLNKHVFVGTVGPCKCKDPAVVITVYQVLPAA